MAKRPWLSVLIPTYNGTKYLPAALESILVQKDASIECIAVDDCSTDDTISILNAFQDKMPIRIFQRERQRNWVSNTNRALSYATGDYTCFLHQDDIWFNNRINTIKPLIDRHPEINLFLHPSGFINKTGKTIGVWKCPLPSSPKIITPDLLIEKLLIQNFISIPAPIFRRETALEVGGLNERLWYTADWDFWLKIATKGNSLYYPTPLSGFRIHGGSQTIQRSSSIQDFREQLESVVNEHLRTWEAPESAKRGVEKAARFSIEVNVSLATSFHKGKKQIINLLVQLLRLGPTRGLRYLRDSRIVERMYARMRTRLEPH